MNELLYNNLPFAAIEKQLYELWYEAFGDSKEYIDTFFASFQPEEITHTLTIERDVVSVLYALPQTLYIGGRKYKAAYIYAVATATAYRGRGYMRKLMKRVEQTLLSRGFEFIYLLPATSRLREYYSLSGFETCSYRKQENMLLSFKKSSLSCCEISSPDVLLRFFDNTKERMSPCVLPSLSMLKVNLDNSVMQGGGAYMLVNGNEPVAVAFIVKKESETIVTDIFLHDKALYPAIADALCRSLGVERITLLVPGEGAPSCMARIISEGLRSYKDVLGNIKIGFVLDK